MIYYARNSSLTETLGGGKRAEVLTAVDNLAQLGKFSQHIQNVVPQGSGAQTTLWKKPGKGNKLRIDLQRIFNTGASETKTVTTYRIKTKVYPTREDAEASLANIRANMRPAISELTKSITSYECIWSLFAVQEDTSYNQIFVLNNPSFSPSEQEWHTLFQNTLASRCAAVVTDNLTHLPSDFEQGAMVLTVAELAAL